MPGVPIYLCAWHVKRAWLKNLTATVADGQKRKEILAALDGLMRLNVQLPAEHSSEDLTKLCHEALESFYEHVSEHKAFSHYFKKEWASKVGRHPAVCTSIHYCLSSFPCEAKQLLSGVYACSDISYAGCRAMGSAVAEHTPLQPGDSGSD